MPRTSKAGKVIQNEILVSMIDSEFQLIRSHLEHVELPSHRSLCEPDELFQFVYFPNAGLISIVVLLSNGKTVEAGLIGKEGIVGLPAVAGRKEAHFAKWFRSQVKDIESELVACEICWNRQEC
jgi:CRP-like cAMP-binding protein